jgi:phospholipid/cholesterol/gamma-HCH transport system substrate-binding protein
METKVNYALVGAFVLILSLAIVAGVLWVSAGGTKRKDYDIYLAYSNESVSGLNRQAPVKYKGVVVGAVKEIGLDPEDPQRVRLELAIERGVPIKEDTVAVLTLQGLTGIAFLDLEGGSKDSPLLAPAQPGAFPVIATRPSLFRRLDTQATALVADLTLTAKSINRLLDDDTRAALQRTIRDLDSVVHEIAGRSKMIDTALVDAARTAENSARASEQLAELTRQIGRSAEAVTRAAERTAVAAEAVRATATDAEGGAQQLRADTLPELQRLLIDARAATASLGRLAQELERSPNALVVGREPMPPGPGE